MSEGHSCEFIITEQDLKRVDAWIKQNNLKKFGHEKDPYNGPIGGAITYSFTPTSLGVILTVKSANFDEELDLTDYESW